MTTEDDIQNWIINFVEQNHEFYDYKFPPCPYAKAARLKGLIHIEVYKSGNKKDFIQFHADQIINNSQHSICVMAFPYRLKWYFHIHSFIKKLNTALAEHDLFIQYGLATQEVTKPYFIVIINKLTDIVGGHKALLSTSYYNNWSRDHYEEVVIRRQQIYEKL